MRTNAASVIPALGLVLGAKAGAVERRLLPATVVPSHYDVHIIPDAEALSFAGEVWIDVEVPRGDVQAL